MTKQIIEELRGYSVEVNRQIQTYIRQIDRMQEDLTVMRAMISFQSLEVGAHDYSPHLSVRRLFKRNEIRGYCLEALRDAHANSLDTRQLARAVMFRKGMDMEDVIIRKRIVFSVMQTMRTARRRGFVQADGKRKGVRVWKLKDGKMPDAGRLQW